MQIRIDLPYPARIRNPRVVISQCVCDMAKLIKALGELSTMVIERKIAVQPENIVDRLYAIADHWPVASEPKRDEALDVLRQMGGEGDSDRVSGNLFIPETMPR